MIYAFEGKHPVVGHGTYVHPSAEILGDVAIGQDCWIGPGARIRGDFGRIVIGSNTCIEENCIVHARPGGQTVIGDWVTIGHGAVVHNATVRDWALVGMGAIVSDWAVVGVWAVIGEGSVVKQRQEIPDEAIAVGAPARTLDKHVSVTFKEEWTGFKRAYAELASRYAAGIVAEQTEESGVG